MPDINIDQVDWEKGDGLVPAVIQDVHNGHVLMLGYMHQAALCRTLNSGKVTIFSRSQTRLWTAGESSGKWNDYVRGERGGGGWHASRGANTWRPGEGVSGRPRRMHEPSSMRANGTTCTARECVEPEGGTWAGRTPQSEQSSPCSHKLSCELGPPSSQPPSFAKGHTS